MTRRLIATAALAAATIAATAAPAAPAAAASRDRAADCHFDGARNYQRFSRIRVFTIDGRLFGCLTDVGRKHRLDTGKMRGHSSATRKAVFGAGDWIGYPARDRDGRARVRATNLRTGSGHGAAAGATVTALVVNFDGTLAWIAGDQVRAKPAAGSTRSLGSDRAIDRRFLGLELEGCAVTWMAGGEQRSSGIYCRHP
jgi:hypothetical protein